MSPHFYMSWLGLVYTLTTSRSENKSVNKSVSVAKPPYCRRLWSTREDLRSFWTSQSCLLLAEHDILSFFSQHWLWPRCAPRSFSSSLPLPQLPPLNSNYRILPNSSRTRPIWPSSARWFKTTVIYMPLFPSPKTSPFSRLAMPLFRRYLTRHLAAHSKPITAISWEKCCNTMLSMAPILLDLSMAPSSSCRHGWIIRPMRTSLADRPWELWSRPATISY